MSLSVATRSRITLLGGIAAIVIGAGLTTVGLSRHHAEMTAASTPPADSAGLAAGQPLADGDYPLPAATTAGSPAPRVRPTTAAPAPKPKPPTTPPRPRPRPVATSATPEPAADSAPATGDSITDQVLTHLNTARTNQSLSAYELSPPLSQASALHTRLMIDGCGLAHQCPAEDPLGKRLSAQGVSFTSAGENIGFGSAGPDDAAIVNAANGLTDSMLAEVPPNDGHRKNLLSPGFHRIGLSVVRDGKGVVWMTQDFVN